MHLAHNKNLETLQYILRFCLVSSLIAVIIISSTSITPILAILTVLPFISLSLNPIIVLTINILYILVLAYSLFLFSKTEFSRNHESTLKPSFYISVELVTIVALTLIRVPHKSPFKPSLGLILMAIIAAPIIEELIFRFLLIGIPLRAYMRFRPTLQYHKNQNYSAIHAGLIIISSIIFGALHYQQGILGIFIGTLGGIILGIIYIKFGLPHAIASHALINAFGVCTILPKLYPLLTPLTTLQTIVATLALLNIITNIILSTKPTK